MGGRSAVGGPRRQEFDPAGGVKGGWTFSMLDGAPCSRSLACGPGDAPPDPGTVQDHRSEGTTGPFEPFQPGGSE
jgi:hypothetical protein